VNDGAKRTERIVVRVSPSMLQRVAALASSSDRRVADWAYLVLKREVEHIEAKMTRKHSGRSRAG